MTKTIPKKIKEEVLSKIKAGEKVVVLAEQYGADTEFISTWPPRETEEETVLPPEYDKPKRENKKLKHLVDKLR